MTAYNNLVGPLPLRAAPGDGYLDWEALYRNKLFARVGGRADADSGQYLVRLGRC